MLQPPNPNYKLDKACDVSYLNTDNLMLRFVNPLFYAHPECFKDITRGTNPGYGGCGYGGYTFVCL